METVGIYLVVGVVVYLGYIGCVWDTSGSLGEPLTLRCRDLLGRWLVYLGYIGRVQDTLVGQSGLTGGLRVP